MTTQKKANRQFVKIPTLSQEGKEFVNKFTDFFHNYHVYGVYVLYEFLEKDFQLLLYITSGNPKKYNLQLLNNVNYILRKNLPKDVYVPDSIKARILNGGIQFLKTDTTIRASVKNEEGHKLKKVCETWFKENYYKEIPPEILEKFEK